MKYRKYYLKDIPVNFEKLICKDDHSDFYQSMDFAVTIRILNMGTAVFFINEERSFYILAYETLKESNRLIINRPNCEELLFSILKEIRYCYDEIMIITDRRTIVKNYIDEVKTSSVFVTPVIDLTQSPDLILKGYSSMRRNIVKRAKSKSFSITIDPSGLNISLFYNMYQATMKRKGYYDEFYAETQFCELLQLESYQLALCEYEGSTAAGIILINHGDRVEGRYVSVENGLKKVNAGSFLTDYCIQYFAAIPCKRYYDFSGYTSLQNAGDEFSGINKFKMSFGPKLKKYYVITI